MANEPPTTTYCLCKTTDVSRFMIECDFCKDWFHGDCLDPRIKQEQADHYEKFYCPNVCFGGGK